MEALTSNIEGETNPAERFPGQCTHHEALPLRSGQLQVMAGLSFEGILDGLVVLLAIQDPFMFGDAVNSPERYHLILEDEAYHYPLFSVPRASVDIQDHMIGVHVSSLIKDGGTIQIGIGSLGDAIAGGLIMRHNTPREYRTFLEMSGIEKNSGDLIDRIGGRDPFKEGLYGATEMLVEVFIDLYKAGIIKRKVYGNTAIQKLVNQGALKENLTPEAVDTLLQEQPYSPVLTENGFRKLKQFGIFRSDLDYRDYRIVNGKASWSADFRDPENRRKVAEECIGPRLANGVLIHGGFFIGSNGFYDELRAMDDSERRQFEMTGVNNVNQLYGDERLRTLQRKDARFVNAGMILSTATRSCANPGAPRQRGDDPMSFAMRPFSGECSPPTRG